MILIDCGSPTSKTSKTYQRSGTTNWGPRQCKLIRMLSVRGTWVGKMALFIKAIDRYGSSNCFEVSMAYRGPAFSLGGGTKVLYIYIVYILDALYKLDTYYNMFDHVWRVLEGFLDFVSPSFESTADQWRLGVFEEVPSLNASTEHDEWMRKVGSIEVKELRNNGKFIGDCCRWQKYTKTYYGLGSLTWIVMIWIVWFQEV